MHYVHSISSRDVAHKLWMEHSNANINKSKHNQCLQLLKYKTECTEHTVLFSPCHITTTGQERRKKIWPREMKHPKTI